METLVFIFRLYNVQKLLLKRSKSNDSTIYLPTDYSKINLDQNELIYPKVKNKSVLESLRLTLQNEVLILETD